MFVSYDAFNDLSTNHLIKFAVCAATGYEELGASSPGVLGSELLSIRGSRAPLPPTYMYGNEALDVEIRANLRSKMIFRVQNRKNASFDEDTDVAGEAGVLVTLEDGTVSREGFIVSRDDLLSFLSLFILWGVLIYYSRRAR